LKGFHTPGFFLFNQLPISILKLRPATAGGRSILVIA
jgi:hypothetical protein